MKAQAKLLLTIGLIILIVVFALLNTTPVPINFGFNTVTWPLVLVLLGALLVGALLMFLLGTLSVFQTKRAVRQEQAQHLEQLTILKNENDRLKQQLKEPSQPALQALETKSIEDVKHD